MNRPTLVTGVSGLLAPYLVSAFRDLGTVVTARRAGDVPCDLADADAVRSMLAAVRPQLILHAAAMTDIDRAEAHPELADIGNRLTTANLVEAMPADCRLVYLSTDQVYANVAGPHREGTEDPINVYGRSKLAGEHAAALSPHALIVRTNLFGPSLTPGRASLSDFVQDAIGSSKEFTLFRDVLFSPLHMTTLASVLRDMIDLDLSGTYNLGSREGMSKAEFGIAIGEQLGLSLDRARIGLSTEMADRAARPLDLRLDVSRLERALGRAMPTCREEIALLERR